MFNAAGIYMIIDVNSPFQGESINRDEPWTSYNKNYLNRVFAVVENFKNCEFEVVLGKCARRFLICFPVPNTLAFFGANEVMNDINTAEFNPQYIRVRQCNFD